METVFLINLILKEKNKIIVVIVLGMIGVTGITNTILANRDPYVCSKSDVKQVTQKLDPIIDQWDSANDLASSSPRITLSYAVNKLQEIQQEVKQNDFPQCSQSVIDNFDKMADENIKAYLLFLSNEDDWEVEQQIRSAKSANRLFVTYYNRLEKGESTDPLKVLKSVLDNTEQIPSPN